MLYIFTSDKAIDLNQETKDERNKAIGTSFVDTVLLASEQDCILLSEDPLVRNLAYLESGTRGVWSQIVLQYCYAHNHIDKSKFFDATLNLIRWGYQITLLTLCPIHLTTLSLHQIKSGQIPTSQIKLTLPSLRSTK